MSIALMDGFKILEKMSEEEIQKRIDWIEEALAIYKTLLTVKQIQRKRPQGLELPTSWVSAVDMNGDLSEQVKDFSPDKPAVRPNMKPPGFYDREVRPVMKQYPDGITVATLARIIGAEPRCLYQHLYQHRMDWYDQDKATKLWYLRNGTINKLEQV